MALGLILLGTVASVLALLWVYFSWHWDYWAKRRVPYCNPLSVFGDRGAGLPFGKPFWTLLDPVYSKYKALGHRFVGTFQGSRPVLVVIDPELAKTILTKEFSSFHGRGQPVDEEGDPLSVSLVSLEGPRWKNLRAKLSPVFTSGKLKLMFPLMTDIGEQLDARVRELAASEGADGEVELRDLLLRYSTDVIGSVAFGITCNSLKGGNDDFHTASREIFNRNILFVIRFFLVSLHPIFLKLMPFRSLFRKTTDFFISVMKETVEYREKNQVDRNDFVKLMMQLRDADRLVPDADRVNHIRFDENLMTAHAFLFFVAGLDNISNTVCFALHELALNPELQERLAEEVHACKAAHGGMTYEAVRQMDLVERTIRESLRKYTPGGFLTREPTTSFKLPESDVVIDKRVMVWVPVWQMTHDPEFFPEPERFDPDRFTEEAKRARHDYAYIPFGEGPRFCIAERFAMLEMKLCLAGLIDKHVLSVGRRTVLVPEFDPKAFAPAPKGGLWLKVHDRPAA